MSCGSLDEGTKKKTSRKEKIEEEDKDTITQEMTCSSGTKDTSTKGLAKLAQACFSEKKYKRSYFIYKTMLSNPKLNPSAKFAIVNNVAVIRVLMGHERAAADLFEDSVSSNIVSENAYNSLRLNINNGKLGLNDALKNKINKASDDDSIIELQGELKLIQKEGTQAIHKYSGLKSDLKKSANLSYGLIKSNNLKEAKEILGKESAVDNNLQKLKERLK